VRAFVENWSRKVKLGEESRDEVDQEVGDAALAECKQKSLMAQKSAFLSIQENSFREIGVGSLSLSYGNEFSLLMLRFTANSRP
jgi:hypothetical protein